MEKSYKGLDAVVEKLSGSYLPSSILRDELKVLNDPNDIIYVGIRILKSITVGNTVYNSRTVSFLENMIVKANEKTRDFKNLSTKDHLTGLSNRRHLDEELTAELAKLYRNPEEKLSLMMFDIDYFKRFNDRYGHNAGDNILVTLSDIVSDSIRGNSAFRYGGDEFCVLLHDTCQSDALKVAQRLNKNIADTKITFTDRSENRYRGIIPISAGVAEINDENPIWLLYGKGGGQLVESYVNNNPNLLGEVKNYLNGYSIDRKSGTKRKTPTIKNTLRNVKEIGDFLRLDIPEGNIDISKISAEKHAMKYVIKQADDLLYHVKNHGRNNVAYNMEDGSIKMIN